MLKNVHSACTMHTASLCILSRVYYGALKAFWEVRIYEMRTSRKHLLHHFYDVCSILEQDGDVYFLQKFSKTDQ